MEEIKPIVAYYGSLQLQDEYQKCITSQKEHHVDLGEYNRINNQSIAPMILLVVGVFAGFATLTVALVNAQEYRDARAVQYIQENMYKDPLVAESLFLKLNRLGAPAGLRGELLHFYVWYS